MTQAYNDLMAIRIEFEEFERNMNKNVEQGIKKYGLTQVAGINAQVANIREELHKLSLEMSFLKPVDTFPESK